MKVKPIRASDEVFDEKAVLPLVQQISPILKGKGPTLQSCVLAELFAMVVAGHVVIDDETKRVSDHLTDECRKDLIEGWLEMVNRLVPLHHERIHNS